MSATWWTFLLVFMIIMLLFIDHLILYNYRPPTGNLTTPEKIFLFMVMTPGLPP
jgi:hypothetical protein